MCGIVGILSPGGIPELALARAMASLAHRGPDGEGAWIAPDHSVGLGHRRLNIVSANGVQPIVSENGDGVLVTNGEFYAYEAQRDALERKGHRFATTTDSEVALHLFEEMGPDCLRHLRGEFALIHWDGRSRTLVAARDRFGIKPLFWGHAGDTLMLGSEAKALFAAGLPARWDYEAVHQQLHGCFLPGTTLFAGVRQIPPGHYLLARNGSAKLVRYWDLDYPRGGGTLTSEAEGEAMAHDLLREAVRLRTRAHVPVGYLVSGGLDSSALLGIGAQVSSSPVHAFAVAFTGAQHDESEKARAAAAHAGAHLHVVHATDDAIADSITESAWHGETLQFNAHGTARFLLSREIQAAGFRAVMAGEGADELFAGYGFLRYFHGSGRDQSRLRQATRLLRVVGRLSDAQRQFAHVSPLLARLSRVAGLPEGVTARVADATALLDSLLAPEFANRVANHDPYRALLRHLDWRQIVGRERAKQALYIWFRTVFPGYHMAADRLDMAHAVEVRLPYLDHELFEAVRHIPVDVLARDGIQKRLLREVVRPYVPEAIYAGRKQPFYAPPSASVPGNRLHMFVQDTLRGKAIDDLPFFDSTTVRTLLDRTGGSSRTGDALLDPILMVVTSLCLLQERFDPR